MLKMQKGDGGMVTWTDIKDRMPEDCLPLRSYKMWGSDRRCTPYVLVIREERERVDCAKRVEIDGTWYWTDGDGVSPVTHWAAYERPVPWDEKAHQERIRRFRMQTKENSHEAVQR